MGILSELRLVFSKPRSARGGTACCSASGRGGSAAPIPDEYNAGHAHLADTDSLMNIGRNVRGRHVQALIDELNSMLPDLQFSAAP